MSNELSRTRKIIAWVVMIVTMLAFALYVETKDQTIKDDSPWIEKAVPIENAAFTAPLPMKEGEYRDWADREFNDMFDGDNAPFTNGDASAANMQNLDFKTWAKGQYRNWLNSAAKADQGADGKRCCGLPDPEDWWDNFIKQTKNGACHMTATNLQQLKCAGEITDQIIVHPAKFIFTDVAECMVGDALSGGLATASTIKWNKLIGHVGGIPVYAPRFTWMLGAPKTLPYLTFLCVGSRYVLRAVNN